MFAIPPPPPNMLITVYRSHTLATRELTCVHAVPSTFQKKWPKNRPSTT